MLEKANTYVGGYLLDSRSCGASKILMKTPNSKITRQGMMANGVTHTSKHQWQGTPNFRMEDPIVLKILGNNPRQLEAHHRINPRHKCLVGAIGMNIIYT
jgi:hypothetical protein